MMQLYAYFGGGDLRQHLEVGSWLFLPLRTLRLKVASFFSNATIISQIDAHVGSVNDLAFCNPTKQLCVITCGDDKAIKVGYQIVVAQLVVEKT